MPRVLEKKERQLGTKLSIRGDRGQSPKSASIKRPYAPGMHGKGGKGHKKLSEFGQQLKEKQKIKFTYGLLEKQLKFIFAEAASKHGGNAENVAEMLESRLDSVVFQLGLAQSRSIARQIVSHGHLLIKGKRVKTANYHVKPGEVITIRPESKDYPVFAKAKENLKNYNVPVWLSINPETLEGKMVSKPRDLNMPFDINLVVDFYSK
jgi:small subunit ribosomal protein S4